MADVSLHRGPRGVALIAVLAILAFLTVIVVGLTLSMKIERDAAHSYEANAAAGLLAGEGVAYVKAALRTAYDVQTNGWVAMPGEIVLTTNGVSTAIPLSSGTTVNTNAGAGVYKARDLNRVSFSQDQLRALTGTAGAGDAMYAGWIYVRQSGARDASQAPTLDPADPIVGRFAFWADDESSRIDLNTAWGGAGNTNGMADPSRVGLSNLFGVDFATRIATNAAARPFASPDDARRLDPALAAAISTNRFSLTHAAYASNLNPWGQPKIVLTTHADYTNGTGSTNFLNILSASATTNTDPGNFAALDQNNLNATVSNLTALLRTNWPGFTNSFAQKYEPTTGAGVSPYRAIQIALDLIEYVRAAESANAIVEPMRGTTNGAGQFLYLTNGTMNNLFFGTARHPLLTQIGFNVATSGSRVVIDPVTHNPVTQYHAQVLFTLYLPPGYTGMSVPASAYTVSVRGSDITPAYKLWSDQSNPTNLPVGHADTSWAGAEPLTPGTSAVIAIDTVYTNTIIGAPIVLLRPPFNSLVGGAVWEISCINSATAIQVPVNIGPTLPPLSSALHNKMLLSETRDPRTKFPDGWTNIQDNLGDPPSVWTNAVDATQDTLAGGGSGGVATTDLVMPAPKGQAGNLAGRVQSVAELGRVFTGGGTNGVPFRTIRLQPSRGGAMPPDWALLDFFTVPVAATNPAVLAAPPGTAAGKVSLNSALLTNGLVSGGGPGTVRTAPLAALFEAATNMTSAARATAAANAAAMTLAAGGTNYGVPYYRSAGELAEVAGVADGGESSEANLQGVVDLATTQGRVFRVYCVGQALQQTPSGQLAVQAEQYKEAIVRAYDPSWTGPSVLLWKSVPQ